MSCWFEVFDNEEVQLRTRRKVTILTAIVVTAAAFSLLCISIVMSGNMTRLSGALVLMGIWGGTFGWCFARLRRLRRVAWCLKVSDDAVVAYDYARKKTVIPWKDITRVEWASDRLLISGPPPASIEIPVLFTDFSALSHTICRLAEEARVPIHIDGKPLVEIDVFRLYPFLRELVATPQDEGSDGFTAC